MAQLALQCAHSFRRNSPGTFQTTILITRTVTWVGVWLQGSAGMQSHCLQ